MPDLTATLMSRLRRAFAEHADPLKADGACAYMRNQFAFYGIPAPVQRVIAREVTQGLPRPTGAELVEVGRRCWKKPQREWQYFACWFLRRHARRREPSLIDDVEHFITTKSWWDTVDTLATHTVGMLVAEHSELVPRMDVWVDSPNIWLVRTAILHQLGYKSRTDAARLFDYCLRRTSEREFFIRKAIGWALREYSKTDAEAVRRFVERNGAALSPLSRSEALKWLTRRSLRAPV